MPLMHRGHSPFWWTGEFPQRIEYPFICVHLRLTAFSINNGGQGRRYC
jgi:hypothetical protein